MASACSIRVRGVVQGVGFRPFVYRLARANTADRLGAQWRRRSGDSPRRRRASRSGVRPRVASAAAARREHHGASMSSRAEPAGFTNSRSARASARNRPTVRISPDLPVCDECLRSCSIRSDRRYHYPYINCTNCGPRYTVILVCPTTAPNTTMADGRSTRIAQPSITIPPTAAFTRSRWRAPRAARTIILHVGDEIVRGDDSSDSQGRADVCRDGQIVAVKGLGGYHLACDARNAAAVRSAARTQVSQGETVRPDGEGSRGRARAGRSVAGSGSAADIRRAADRSGSGEGRASRCRSRQRRTWRDAALHAAASSAVRRRRAAKCW